MSVVNTSRGEIQETAGQRRGEMEAGGGDFLVYILTQPGPGCMLYSERNNLQIIVSPENVQLSRAPDPQPQPQPQPPAALSTYQSLSASRQLLTSHTPATDLWSNFWKM